jgi:hypothetical protein
VLDLVFVSRDGRSSQQKEPATVAMVNPKANRIPKNGRYLPFVNQPRSFAIQYLRRTNPRHQYVMIAFFRFIHVNHASGQLLASGGLATPFYALKQYRASGFEPPFYD